MRHTRHHALGEVLYVHLRVKEPRPHVPYESGSVHHLLAVQGVRPVVHVQHADSALPRTSSVEVPKAEDLEFHDLRHDVEQLEGEVG